MSGTPVSGIVVNVGKVQALYSTLASAYSPVIAGATNTFKIQAKDINSNVVVETNELFDFEVLN